MSVDESELISIAHAFLPLKTGPAPARPGRTALQLLSLSHTACKCAHHNHPALHERARLDAAAGIRPEDRSLLMLALVIQPLLHLTQLCLEALPLLAAGDRLHLVVITHAPLGGDDVSLQLILGLCCCSPTLLCFMQLLHPLPSCLQRKTARCFVSRS